MEMVGALDPRHRPVEGLLVRLFQLLGEVAPVGIAIGDEPSERQRVVGLRTPESPEGHPGVGAADRVLAGLPGVALEAEHRQVPHAPPDGVLDADCAGRDPRAAGAGQLACFRAQAVQLPVRADHELSGVGASPATSSSRRNATRPLTSRKARLSAYFVL